MTITPDELTQKYPCGRVLGQGGYATCYAHKTDPDKVVLVDTSSEAKALGYKSIGLLFAEYQEIVEDWGDLYDIHVYVVKRLNNDEYDQDIRESVRWFDNQYNHAMKNLRIKSDNWWHEYETITYNDRKLDLQESAILDIATNPDTPEHISRFFIALLTYAFDNDKEIWTDNHTGNWLKDDNGLCYPLDVLNFRML